MHDDLNVALELAYRRVLRDDPRGLSAFPASLARDLRDIHFHKKPLTILWAMKPRIFTPRRVIVEVIIRRPSAADWKKSPFATSARRKIVVIFRSESARAPVKTIVGHVELHGEKRWRDATHNGSCSRGPFIRRSIISSEREKLSSRARVLDKQRQLPTFYFSFFSFLSFFHLCAL